MLVWGIGHKNIRADLDVFACPVCKRTARRITVVDYDYSHIYWLFKGLKHLIVSVECEACGTVQEIDKNDQKVLFTELGRNPIPFMDRYGAHVLLAIIISWVGFAFVFPCFVNPASEVCAESIIDAQR